MPFPARGGAAHRHLSPAERTAARRSTGPPRDQLSPLLPSLPQGNRTTAAPGTAPPPEPGSLRKRLGAPAKRGPEGEAARGLPVHAGAALWPPPSAPSAPRSPAWPARRPAGRPRPHSRGPRAGRGGRASGAPGRVTLQLLAQVVARKGRHPGGGFRRRAFRPGGARLEPAGPAPARGSVVGRLPGAVPGDHACRPAPDTPTTRALGSKLLLPPEPALLPERARAPASEERDREGGAVGEAARVLPALDVEVPAGTKSLMRGSPSERPLLFTGGSDPKRPARRKGEGGPLPQEAAGRAQRRVPGSRFPFG